MKNSGASDSDDEIDLKRKKKYSKKGSNVPYVELGFRPKVAYDVIDPRNLPRAARRRKPKYHQRNSKENFLSRLRMVVDVQDLPPDTPSHQFNVSKLGDWAWVRKVFYRSRDKVYCSICLEEDIVAPQITFCGHIFCFHCILTHFQKSQNSTLCPVCKQPTSELEIKTCEPLRDGDFNVSDQITLNLKYRVGRTIYDSETLVEDLNFEQIIRMRARGILSIFQAEQAQLRAQLERTPTTQRNHHYLKQAIAITITKIEKSKQIIANTSQHVKLRDNQRIKGDTILKTAEGIDQSQLESFFQEQSGRFIFLHQICQRYLKDCKQIGRVLKAVIMEKQETWYGDRINDYKHLSHLNPSVEIDLVIIDMEEYLPKEAHQQFSKHFKEHQHRRQELQKKEEEEAEYRSKYFEEHQKYIRELKDMEASQFEISLPTELDPTDLNEHTFPSLISESAGDRIEEIPVPTQILRTTTQQPLQAEDFPELGQIKPNKSMGPSKPQGKRGKKKKEKKVDMTHLLFADREEDD